MNFDFMGKRSVFFSISGIVIVASLILLMTKGINFGIDFQGGTLLERSVPKHITVADVESVLADEQLQQLGIGRSFVQPLESDDENETIFLIRTASFTDNEQLRVVDNALEAAFGSVTERRTEVVGPVIGRELRKQAILALIIAGAGILAYISFRFEYRFAVIAVTALIHDVIVVLGVFVLLGIEVNTSFIAAVLTVVGYSINDTIVIFDRIRENMRSRRRRELTELVNTSVNETLSRTINTSLTTMFVVLALFIFGGDSIRDFTLALLVGVIGGTYSSICIASPLWLTWRQSARGTTEEQPVS